MKIQTIVLICLCASQSLAGKLMKNQNTRIVGGVDAQEGVATYQCSLQKKRSHFCGCAIINNTWVITAAHCIVGTEPGDLEVLVGTNNLMKGGTRYKASDLYPHTEYNIPAYANDIGLIHINGAISFNSLVQPIEYSKQDVKPNSVMQLTGWGQLSKWGEMPNALQIIELLSISYNQCKDMHAVFSDVDIGHICTLTKRGEGACFGDSGGPLTFEGQLVGIVNWGIPCAKGFPDVYASVSYYFGWIQNTIKSHS